MCDPILLMMSIILYRWNTEIISDKLSLFSSFSAEHFGLYCWSPGCYLLTTGDTGQVCTLLRIHTYIELLMCLHVCVLTCVCLHVCVLTCVCVCVRVMDRRDLIACLEDCCVLF